MTVSELIGARTTSRRVDQKHTHIRRYLVEAPEHGAAMGEMLTFAPPEVVVFFKILIVVDSSMEETDNPSIFFGEVQWATIDHTKTKHANATGTGYSGTPNETGDSEQSFSIGGGTQHVQEAISQKAYPAAAPDVLNAINVANDGIVEGVDIITPQMTFTKTHYLPVKKVTADYIKSLGRTVGKTNDAEHLGFDKATLLLLSATGRQRGAGDWAVTFDYAAGENKTGQTVAGFGDITKNAHDYLWVLYEQSEDAVAKKMVPKAVGVYVATVYEATSFTILE